MALPNYQHNSLTVSAAWKTWDDKNPWTVADVEWFTEHLQRDYRLRSAFSGETIRALRSADDIILNDSFQVVVRQKRRGVHLRIAANFNTKFADDDDTLSALFDMLEGGGSTLTAYDVALLAKHSNKLGPRTMMGNILSFKAKNPDQELEPKFGHVNEAKETDDDIAEINKRYALVIIGDKAAVLDTDEIKFLTVPTFELWFANQFVRVGEKATPLGKYWTRHPQRRQYAGIEFAPGRETKPEYFNLWRGFAVEPKQGDCSKFLAHLHDNVCQGKEDLNNWVVGWFAQIAQRPSEKEGTSLVLRGAQGVGKTKVGEVIGSLLDHHYTIVSEPRYVTGRFNSHLSSCLLLHCDEAFWAGDHAAEGRLKDLITGQTNMIEFKGKEVIKVRNYVRLLITGNPHWLVPAGFEERRFAVLDVGEQHMKDGPYFAAIDAEMKNGGREALLYYLLNFDLKSVDLRTTPTTAALFEQKVASFNSLEGWWCDVLMRGELPLNKDNTVPTSALFELYIAHANNQGIRRRALEVQVGSFLNKLVPELIKRDRLIDGSEKRRQKVYVFPSLAKCRAAFAQKLRHEEVWSKKANWSNF